VVSAVVNAASYEPGVAAGTLETIFGAHLAGAQVLLNGRTLSLLYRSDSQINFYVPADTPLGPATLATVDLSGEQASMAVTVAAVQPGIFRVVFDRGFLELWCTGLGPTHTGPTGLQETTVTPVVFIGATPVTPVFSGISPTYPGLYQVNVQIPPGLAPGPQSVLLSVSLLHSNQVPIVLVQ
jgi:hypothetical protein